MTENEIGRLGASSIAMLTLTSLVLFASAANAGTIDFEYLAHGEIANGTIDGVTIGADNFSNTFDYAVGFDSRSSGTADADLEANTGAMPWTRGNIAGTQLGTILVLQENNTGCDSGICSSPDDEGARPAGVLSFDFSMPILGFGFDAVDIESVTAENAMISFFDNQTRQMAQVNLTEFFDMSSALYDASLELGNNSANRFAPITVAFLGISQIDRVEFRFGGSGGLDNLVMTPMPEPSTALLLGLGLAGIAAKRKHLANREAPDA
jgi:hypothetical protein